MADSKKLLLVPVHLDAMFLEKERFVSDSKTIFNRLPYNDGKRDVNRDVANISEHFLTSPFRNDELLLKKGVHLHWILPDALKKGILHKNEAGEERLLYPKVPNRWLVSKFRSVNTAPENQWVIESDYLHPEGNNCFHQSIAFPIDLKDKSGIKSVKKNLRQPFRYMGRCIRFGSWKMQDPDDEYLSNLTAVGYGEPTFSSFYPNCYSVFGFYDADILNAKDLSELRYDLVGWYSEKGDNLLSNADFQTEIAKIHQNDFPEALEKLFNETFGWKIDKNITEKDDIPSNMLCYSRLKFAENYEINSKEASGGINVSIGNTGTDALLPVVSEKLSDNYTTRQTIEEQLKAIRVISKFDSYQSDKIHKFKEAYHEKSFTATSGGKLWYVHEDTNTDLDGKDASSANNLEDNITLPDSMSHMLNLLNIKQNDCDSVIEKITFQKQQLFSYWYKYMMCLYPPDDGRHEYPKPDEIKYYIDDSIIPGIEALNQSQADLLNEREKSKCSVTDLITSFNDGRAPYFLQKIFNKKESIDDDVIVRGTSSDNDQVLADLPKFVEGGSFIKEYLDFSLNTEFNNGLEDQSSVESDIPSTVVGSFIKIENPNFKAVSFWINISSQQVAVKQNAGNTSYLNPTLLIIGEDDDSIMSSQRTGNLWNKIVVNGEELKKRYNSNFLWSDIPKDRWIHVYCEVSEAFSGKDLLIMSKNQHEGFLHGKIASLRLFKDGLSNEEISCDQNIFAHLKYKLQSKEAPRYWQPNEPVVLMEGDIFKFNQHHGFDEKSLEKKLLECKIFESRKELNFSQEADISYIQSQISELEGLYDKEKMGYNYIKKQPCNPMILEWEVELFPVKNKGNLFPDKRSYSQDFITDNFKIDEDRLNLLPRNQALKRTKSAAVYRGATFITPSSKFMLAKDIKSYLIKLNEDDFKNYLVSGVYFDKWFSEKPELSEETFCTNFTAFKEWYKKAYTGEEIKNDPIYTAILAYEQLCDMHAMSQSLGGFNSSLIMKRQALQLPIDDPLGFQHYRKFTEKVKNYISGESKYTPLPLNDFNPIISGSVRILKLRILDSFGKYINVLNGASIRSFFNTSDFVLSDGFEKQKQKSANLGSQTFVPDVLLPTRLAFPARLALRWFSAEDFDQEMNSHPASSPICGWLLANNLDGSIMVYVQDGSLLGVVRQNGHWSPSPGNDEVIDIQHIPNKYLMHVVQKLAVNDTEDDKDIIDLKEFITVTNKTLEKIDPESFLHDQDLALLMGRPMAVVRAGVKFEVQGGIPINRSWTALRQELLAFLDKVKRGYVGNNNKGESEQKHEVLSTIKKTDSLENVGIPIYIGDCDQFNDGVIGYWQEDKEGNLSKEFYTSLSIEDCKMLCHEDSTIQPSIDDEPNIIKTISSEDTQNLTMLIDPRGKVHASCGILPKKTIDIPVDQYVKALSAINVTFLSSPIISSVEQIRLPIPNEPGYVWSWLQNVNSNWYEKSSVGIVRKKQFVVEFNNALDIWTELKRKGWIKEFDTVSAIVVPTDQRTGDLGEQFSQEVQQIEKVLNGSYIGEIDIKSSFDSKNAIYEGWLKLSRTRH